MKKRLIWLALPLTSLHAIAQPPKNDFDEQNGTGKATVVTFTLDQAFQKLPSFTFGGSFQALNAIQKAVTDSKKTPAQREALAARLGAVLSDGAATKEAKKFACRQLMIIGGAAQVPALNTLLIGEDADLAFFARYVLERINEPAVGTALRDALGKTKGATLVGVIDSLGTRRDSAAVASLTKLAGDADQNVASASLIALGKIGGPAALAALPNMGFLANSPLLHKATESGLRAANALTESGQGAQASALFKMIYEANKVPAVRMNAWRGLVKTSADSAPLVVDALKSTDRAMQMAAVGVANELPASAVEKIAATLNTLPAETQGALLTVWGAQTLPGVRTAALAALKSDNENVRLAALNALGASGDVSAIIPLAQSAANGSLKEKPVAQNSLSRLRGATIDAELVKNVDGATPLIRVALLQALGARRASSATPALLKAASDTDENVRVAALDALGALSTEADVPRLLELQAKLAAKPGRELTAIEKAIAVAASSGKPETRSDMVLAALNGADAARRASLLRVAGSLGGEKAYAALSGGVKDTDPAVRDAAVRALAQSTEQAAGPLLLDVAQNSDSALHKTLAFRAYVKLAGDTTLKTKERLTMYQSALTIAPATEKRLVLGGLGTLNSLDALKIVAPLLDDAAARDDAAAATAAIAQLMLNGKVADSAKESLRAALTKVVEVSKNEAARKQATDLLKKL